MYFFGGTKTGTSLQMDANLMHYSQITIKGVFHTTPLCVETAFHLLEIGIIDVEDFIQHEYSLESLEEAILEHANQKVIKNCIIYNQERSD